MIPMDTINETGVPTEGTWKYKPIMYCKGDFLLRRLYDLRFSRQEVLWEDNPLGSNHKLCFLQQLFYHSNDHHSDVTLLCKADLTSVNTFQSILHWEALKWSINWL